MAEPKLEHPKLRDFALPKVPTVACPIQTSLGVLGRKWALAVLRDVAFFEGVRFTDVLRMNRGLTPRMLTFRLRDLIREGFIERVVDRRRGRNVAYRLSPKGQDAIPILTALMSFGLKHHADVVFKDGKARSLNEQFPGSQCAMLGPVWEYAMAGGRRSPDGKSIGGPKDVHRER